METQKQIAIKAELTPGALGNILAGRRRPSWRLAKKLAEATDTTPELWLEGSPDQIRSAIGRSDG